MSEAEVRDVLMSFFDAMGKWEADSRALYRKAKKQELDYEDVKSQTLSDLIRVFDLYCIYTDTPARARCGAPHVSLIPTYGADLEEVISVDITGDRAMVLTRQTTDTKFMLRYNVVKTLDGWRIEDNRKTVQPDGKEVDWDL